MAITGDGSQNNPYVVTTAAEIGEAITAVRAKPVAGKYYISLANDIDGHWSVFPALNFSDPTTKFFELSGNYFEVTNFRFNNGVLFGVEGDVLKDFVLYNFSADNDRNGFVSGIESYHSSLSCKIGNHSRIVLDDIKCTKSAFWASIDEYDTDTPVVRFREGDAADVTTLDNSNESDYMIYVDNMNASSATIIDSRNTQTLAVDSRIQGGIAHITPASITSYPAITSSRVPFDNAVINFTLPAYGGTVTSGAATLVVGTGTTGIIDTDKILETTYASYSLPDLKTVNDTELHDADTLTLRGFPVYDISP